MIKTITKQICDLCKNEVQTNEYCVPVYRAIFTDSNGYFTSERLDLCDKCIEKVTVIQGFGIFNNNKYKLRGKNELR